MERLAHYIERYRFRAKHFFIDFLGIWYPELLICLGFVFATLIVTSVTLLAATHPVPTMLFQADLMEEIVKYVSERPISLTTLIFVVVYGTRFYVKFQAQHEELRKRLGLVPLEELTEDEKQGLVVSTMKLTAALDKQSAWIEKRFVTGDKLQELQREMLESFIKMLQIRQEKEDKKFSSGEGTR